MLLPTLHLSANFCFPSPHLWGIFISLSSTCELSYVYFPTLHFWATVLLFPHSPSEFFFPPLYICELFLYPHPPPLSFFFISPSCTYKNFISVFLYAPLHFFFFCLSSSLLVLSFDHSTFLDIKNVCLVLKDSWKWRSLAAFSFYGVAKALTGGFSFLRSPF